MFLTRGEELKSSIGLVGGSKYAPKPLGGRPGFFIQEDNVAVEFNIPPASTLQEFCDSIDWSVKEIAKEVEKFGLWPKAIASAVFPESELAEDAAHHFGCDPDYNAWKGGRRNPRPRSRNPRLRSCGGHIHVGYSKDAGIDKFKAVQLMDLYLGVPSIMMDQDQDRRKLYGKAGAYRNTDYGFEYRVLSNFWLGKPELVEWAYTQTIRAVNKSVQFKDKEYEEFMDRHNLRNDIIKCINKSNVNLSSKLITFYDLNVR